MSSVAQPADFRPEDATGVNTYLITATNIGNEPTSATKTTITDKLPAGLTATSIEFRTLAGGIVQELGPTLCSIALVRCSYPGSSGLPPIPPGDELFMIVHVATHPATPETVINSVTVTGGGAPEASTSSANRVDSAPAPFGMNGSVSDLALDGSPSTQAGSHPYSLTTTLNFNLEPLGTRTDSGAYEYVPTEDPKSIVADLPPGLIGNPQAVPLCSLAQLAEGECPVASQIGRAQINAPKVGLTSMNIYNLKAQVGYAGELAFNDPHSFLPTIVLGASVRTGGDYGLRIVNPGGAAAIGLEFVKVTIWGVPGDPSHDRQRGQICGGLGCIGGGLSSGIAEPKPYLTNPTFCSGESSIASVSADSWEHPGQFSHSDTSLPAIDGCNQVPFEPTIEARPTTNHADSPSGLDFDLRMPLKGLEEAGATAAESNLRNAVVTLPEGLLVNPSSAAGLEGCSAAQIELHGPEPASCPDASKIGTVAVKTPLLDHPLPGAVYLARQGENPFGSLLALYVAINDPQTGIVVKLAGKVEPDGSTGRLTTKFEENPQLPFEDFNLKFFGGALGALRTPPTCGTYTTNATLTPWSAPESGPPAEKSDEFQITGSASGSGACPSSPGAEENAPRFHAGTENTQAGAFSPFSFKLVREDGSQELKGIDTTLPPGLVGRLAGIGECSDAQLAVASDPNHSGKEEQVNPSCPASSEVGTVDVGAGAGPTPLYVQGHAYLAGPYKGAPLSLAIITPAVAGPFDLGTVVVRTALHVDPFTAQIHAVSDEIPHILQGIPLDVRSVTLKMNRPNFTLNPTNCNELGFTGSATSVQGAIAALAQRFQVGGCAALPFKPKLAISLKGGVKRHTFPALTATLTMPGGQANVGSAQVTLPHNEQLEQAHITSQVCTQPQLASQTCPKASIYGYAKAETPLLDHPLEGPVYLGVGFGHKLPDLVAELNGQIRVLLHGKVDTGREDGLRNTFEVVPDAPVSRFTLHMFGGKKGLIVNSENLCGKHAKHKALARFTAQSGKVVEFEPTVANSCKHKHGKHSKGAHKHRPARALRSFIPRGW